MIALDSLLRRLHRRQRGSRKSTGIEVKTPATDLSASDEASSHRRSEHRPSWVRTPSYGSARTNAKGGFAGGHGAYVLVDQLCDCVAQDRGRMAGEA